MWENFLKPRNSLFTNVLLVFLTSIVTVWFLQILWKRRKIYQESMNLPGPFALPLFGSSLAFVKNRHGMYKNTFQHWSFNNCISRSFWTDSRHVQEISVYIQIMARTESFLWYLRSKAYWNFTEQSESFEKRVPLSNDRTRRWTWTVFSTRW